MAERMGLLVLGKLVRDEDAVASVGWPIRWVETGGRSIRVSVDSGNQQPGSNAEERSVNAVGKRKIGWLGRALCVGIAVTGVVAVGQPAHAYTLKTNGGCTEVRWTSPNPVYKIHIYEFARGGGSTNDLVALFAAVYDVMREFNNAGATTAMVDTSGINSDARAYESSVPFNDPNPTIHIGFTDDPYEVDSTGTARASTTFSVDQKTCTYNEVRITFRTPNLQPWDYGTPESANVPYYTATDTDGTTASTPAGTLSKWWFRPIMMHELLHAFGLDHSINTYSFMNYLDYPWAGGGVAETDAIRPLPDDLRALRYLYPGSGSRSEIALLTTWYNSQIPQGGSAAQVHVCAPSLGDKNSDSPLDSYYCGTGGSKAGSTKVCAGDRLYTWFTFANYSTETADGIDVRMYLSTDDVYDSTDPISPTGINVTVDSGRSKAVGKGWEVPSGLTSGTSYHVIIHAIGTTSSGAWVEDWTPLTAPVTAC